MIRAFLIIAGQSIPGFPVPAFHMRSARLSGIQRCRRIIFCFFVSSCRIFRAD